MLLPIAAPLSSTAPEVSKAIQHQWKCGIRLGMRSKGTASELEARRRTAIVKHHDGLDSGENRRVPKRPSGHRRQVGRHGTGSRAIRA